jgi:uncharacterized protein YndB with AHSA1/START domain
MTATDPLRLRVRINAAPDSVFRALTDADSLTVWLAELAEVSLDEGRYEFWGRFVPQGDRARQRLLGCEPDRSLRFAWAFAGADGASNGDGSTVEMSLEHAPDGATVVALAHSGTPAGGSANPTALQCFWHVSLGNLSAYCEGTPTAPSFDFTVPAQGEARVRSAIAVSPDEVYSSLMDPVQVNRWAGGKAVIEASVGGRYDFGWDHGPGQILELEPDRLLAYSWRYPGSPETIVRWELRSSRGHTFVTLVHSGFADDDLAEQFRQGWPGFLMEIKRQLEVGPSWQPISAAGPGRPA